MNQEEELRLASIWASVCLELQQVISPQGVDRWFRHLRLQSYVNRTLTLHHDTPIYQYWIEQNYLPELTTAASQVLGEPITIVFQSDVSRSSGEGRRDLDSETSFERLVVAETHLRDTEARLAFLRNELKEWPVKLSDAVLDFIAERFKTDLNRLKIALNMVASTVFLRKQEITVPQVEVLLRDHLEREVNRVEMHARFWSSRALHV